MERARGFTLIEVLIVVAIIAILAAIMIPSLFSAIHRAKQKRAMSEIRGLATACNSYSTDTNIYPLANTSWQDTDVVIPVGELAPYYIKEVPNPDPWDIKYQYSTTDSGSDFALRSMGKGGQDDGETFASSVNAAPAATLCLENDIVWVNGGFVLWPEGKQRKCD